MVSGEPEPARRPIQCLVCQSLAFLLIVLLLGDHQTEVVDTFRNSTFNVLFCALLKQYCYVRVDPVKPSQKRSQEIARNGVCNPNTNASYDLLARSTLKMQSLVNSG